MHLSKLPAGQPEHEKGTKNATGNVSPVVSIAFEQIQKEEQAEHCYCKGPVFIKLVQNMVQKLHYAPPAYKNSTLNGERVPAAPATDSFQQSLLVRNLLMELRAPGRHGALARPDSGCAIACACPDWAFRSISITRGTWNARGDCHETKIECVAQANRNSETHDWPGKQVFLGRAVRLRID